MPDESCDIVVIGGGIVGLGTAMEFSRLFPRLQLVVLEKEDRLAAHQSGHNSGVIHSGIYYKPGSIKARTCVEGAAAMVEFCERYGIRHEICGKLIVATNEEESCRLEELRKRGEENGLTGVRTLTREGMREIEPHCAGVRALQVPSTGIVDYKEVCGKYAELITEQGGKIRLRTQVRGLVMRSDEIVVETTSGTFGTRYLINCAGLHSDRVVRMSGGNSDIRIVPFRGEYYVLRPERRTLVKGLIYPVPDPRFPFLGVHFTRRVDGDVDAGPNAVLALKREGYRKGDISFTDIVSEFSFPGFWRMAGKNWRTGLHEMYRSFNKRVFVRDLQRLVPDVNEGDLVPAGSGVRAQAVQTDGSLVDDFRFELAQNVVHVCNVPSPAATASIAIGKAIVQMASQNFGLR
jgi:L-2-hydroxyglutarate oxidase